MNKLQEELTQPRLITETVSEENLRLKERIGKTGQKLAELEEDILDILQQTNESKLRLR